MFARMKRPGIEYKEAKDLVCNLAKAEVDKYAAKAAGVLGFKPGADISALVKTLGGRIHVEDLFGTLGDEDTIYVHKAEDFDIILSTISSPRRDRFTIAHELGHYFLHSKQGRLPLVAARDGSDRAE